MGLFMVTVGLTATYDIATLDVNHICRRPMKAKMAERKRCN